MHGKIRIGLSLEHFANNNQLKSEVKQFPKQQRRKRNIRYAVKTYQNVFLFFPAALSKLLADIFLFFVANCR